MSTPDIVITERHDDVACIVLNRPEKLNALTHEMIGRVRDALVAAQSDPLVKVILLRGQGRAFCAGDDLEDLSAAAAEAEKQSELVEVLQDVTRQIMTGPKPVVAVVQGWAIGAAFSWVLNCDLVVCAKSATAFFPELKWGVSPTGAATALAPRLLGVTAARAAFHDFKRFSADDLLALGAVSRVVADENALAAGMECARDLASRPQAALQGLKQLVNRSLLPSLDSILADEAQLAVAMAVGEGVSGRIDSFRQPARA
jgi:enoyl-CoA hydratase/carnithine racemase